MNRAADQVRTLHDPRTEAARPASVLVWPGSPFPLPISQFGGLILTILLIMIAAGIYLINRERRTAVADTPNVE